MTFLLRCIRVYNTPYMKFIFLFLFSLMAGCAWGQYAEPEYNGPDTMKTSYLDEVVVSANKINETRRNVAQQVKIISPATIRSFNAQTAADLLQNTGVVGMQRSQQGGGSPILRGFEASRVLLVVDGVRMNNLIYRAGHLQNAITVDNNVLERAEVLFGPSSTVYGSDALGGVVHFFTRMPEVSAAGGTRVSGNVFFRYGSVNSEQTSHADVSVGGKKWASLTSLTFSDFGDLRMGKRINRAWGQPFGVRNQYVQRASDNSADVLITNPDPFVQTQSAYKQLDVLQKVLFKPSARVSHLLNFQYSNTNDVPRYDRLTDPGANNQGLRFAEWYYGPQRRVMAAYQLKVSEVGAWADQLTATVSYQDVEESRYTRRFGSSNLDARIENVGVGAVTLDFAKTVGMHQLRYGFDSQFNGVVSTASRTNIITGAQTGLDTRYPGGDNTLNNAALYITHTAALTSKLILNDGVRIGYSHLRASFTDKTFFPFPFDQVIQNNPVASANVGVIYHPSSWKLSLMASSGYRVPNMDDLAKVFETVAGTSTTTGIINVPNPNLVPEKTLNGDLGVTKFFGSVVRAEAVFFATSFYDALATQPFRFNGQPVLQYNGFPANVVASQNVNRAYLFGYSSSLRADLSGRIALTASYNYTRGRLLNTSTAETPLDHIPPAFGRAGVVYTAEKLKAEVFSNFNGWKRLRNYSPSGEDNLVYATAQGMPRWWTLNLRGSYQISPMFTIQAGIDNLFDLQYRLFASGINSPGRNIFGTVRVGF